MSLLFGLTTDLRLGGILALSGYLPLAHKAEQLRNPENVRNMRVGQFHGREDGVVGYQWGTMTRDKLAALGYKVDFHSYDGLEHSSSPEEIQDVLKWLEGRIE